MIKAKIKNILAYEVLTSSGQATLELKIISDNKLSASVAFPFDNYQAPFSTKDITDNDSNRFKGFGRLNAIRLIEEQVAPQLLDLDIFSQVEIDEKLNKLNDGDKQLLGPAIIFCISLACAKLAALIKDQELYVYLQELYQLEAADKKKLPLPVFNLFNGGDTGDTNLDFQEFLLFPKREMISEIIKKGSEVFLELADVLKEAGLDTDTGQEGGYAPEIDSSIEAIELMLSAIIRCGYQPGVDFSLGIDIGSSILYDRIAGKYLFSLDRNYLSSLDMSSLYEEWLSRYPLVYLEDPFNELDWESWQQLNGRLGQKLLIAGDDMISSNIKRLRESVGKNAFNTVVLKPAKAGTLTDSIKYAKLVKDHGYKLVVSALNHETSDNYLSDLAVVYGAMYLKAGSLSRGERVEKYNRLAEIERNLNNFK